MNIVIKLVSLVVIILLAGCSNSQQKTTKSSVVDYLGGGGGALDLWTLVAMVFAGVVVHRLSKS